MFVVLVVVSSFLLRCTDRVRVVVTEFPLFVVMRVTVPEEELLRVLLVPTVLGADVVAALFPLFETDCLSLARFVSSVTVRFVPMTLGP